MTQPITDILLLVGSLREGIDSLAAQFQLVSTMVAEGRDKLTPEEQDQILEERSEHRTELVDAIFKAKAEGR